MARPTLTQTPQFYAPLHAALRYDSKTDHGHGQSFLFFNDGHGQLPRCRPLSPRRSNHHKYLAPTNSAPSHLSPRVVARNDALGCQGAGRRLYVALRVFCPTDLN